jgi:hypothetical protein
MVDFETKEKNGNELIDATALLLDARFFLDCGEGRDCETDTLYLMDMSGWLIPFGTVDEFVRADRQDDKWDEFFVFAEWRKEGNDILIDFNKYDMVLDN